MAAMHQGLPAASPVPVVAADRVIPAATSGEPARERQAIQAELAAAVGNHHLTLHYQPQVDLGTGQVCGAEALLRWNRPGHGLVPPGHFIDVAEDSGLILPIGQWVVHEACQRAAIWPRHLGIAVNVSPLQFRDPGLYKAVLDAIRGSGIMPSRLELEITERMMLPDSEETLATLRRLRELGVRLAMDDFGTGYSGLGYLQRFRFDKVKIDRSFTCRLGEDPSAAAIVRAVVGLAESLGLCVNAEGVETALQDETLRSLGCSEGQGFLYGRPVPHEVFNAKHLEAAPEIGTLSAAPATGPPG
jgi:EAL domain-containing protein (putative c-di-GMP-specific phosphodiesterase class I)